MSSSRALPLGLLLAASSLSAQVIISGAGGLASETYSTAIDTTGGKTLSLAFMVDYLVVGGGGGGAGSGIDSSAWGGGGGGAGGMRSGQFSELDNKVYTVTVGGGGQAGPRNSTTSLQQGTNGGNSVLGDVTALGGGGGGAYKLVGNTGGSGGGGGGRGTGNNLRTAGGDGTDGQGFDGGASRDDNSDGRSAGGGGGGAGGVGGQGGTDVSNGGNGGIGLASDITGTSVLYAAGGGGGAIDTNGGAAETAGLGGSGIGGNGSTSGNASAGATNTGSGGGGVGHQGAGGNGGSGVVIVRYKGGSIGSSTGGTITSGTGTSTGYTLHTFTTVGNSTFSLGTLSFNTRLGSVVSSSISGTGALTVNTKGTIRYTGDATHTGGTVITAGTLQLGNGGTEGSLSGDVSIGVGATLDYNRSSNTSLRLSSTGALVKKGTGVLTITDGDVAFSGALTVNAGTLQLGSSFATNAANITFSGGRISSDGASARTLARGIQLTTNGLSLGDSINNGALTFGGNVSLSGMSAISLNVDSEVIVSGVISGFYSTVGLNKLGSGTLVLSGNNTYTGNTTVSAGKLIVNGTQARSAIGFQSQGEHFIAAGATLGGSGTILGDTTISGTHTPGNSPGIQNFGNLTYNTGSSIVWELGANTTSNTPLAFDQIFATGTLNFAGATLLNLVFDWSGGSVDWNDTFWDADQSWQIIFGNNITGANNLSLSSNNWQDINGLTFNQALAGAAFSISQSGQYVYLNYTSAIPEPSTYGLILGGLALAGAALRRRKQSKK